MKKILFFLMIIFTVLGLCSCKKEETKGVYYAPIASTAEESRVVMSFTVDGRTYDVRYELYRALFVGNRYEVDGGDDSVWTGPLAEDKINEINEIIVDKAAEIYSTLDLAQRLGINAYSFEADLNIQYMIDLYVKGGESESGTSVVGYGSYDKFLASLKKKGMNYATCELMFRYSYALERINEYYVGTYGIFGYTGGKLNVTDKALKDYYYSDECVRVLEAYFQVGTKTEERIGEIRDSFENESSIKAIAAKIIQYTTVTSSELIDTSGNVVGKAIGYYELDSKYYSEYISEAFSLSHGDVSRVICIDNINDIYADGYYVLIGVEKDDQHFENSKSHIKSSYVNNEIGKILYAEKESMAQSVLFAQDYEKINHSELIK